jgi:hypothetical protein
MTSIFFLTSNFNNSIHSTFAVDERKLHIHEKWKRENRKMVAKKKAGGSKKGGKKGKK